MSYDKNFYKNQNGRQNYIGIVPPAFYSSATGTCLKRSKTHKSILPCFDSYPWNPVPTFWNGLYSKSSGITFEVWCSGEMKTPHFLYFFLLLRHQWTQNKHGMSYDRPSESPTVQFELNLSSPGSMKLLVREHFDSVTVWNSVTPTSPNVWKLLVGPLGRPRAIFGAPEHCHHLLLCPGSLVISSF